jgi:hypothetical protein
MIALSYHSVQIVNLPPRANFSGALGLSFGLCYPLNRVVWPFFTQLWIRENPIRNVEIPSDEDPVRMHVPNQLGGATIFQARGETSRLPRYRPTDVESRAASLRGCVARAEKA